jgi:hypothetical protein
MMMSMAWVSPTGFAQEQSKDKAADSSKEDAAAAQAAARRRALYGPNIAKAEFGEAEVSIMGGKQKADSHDAQSVESVKPGEVLMLTESQALKLKTYTDLKFGNVTAKYENVAKNYPGVYSIWLKKTEQGWNACFNEKPDMWGTQYDPEKDVGETPIEFKTLDEPVKTMTVKVDKKDNSQGVIRIALGKYEWSLPFTVLK